ncbi:hypothetical protein AVEN_105713-1 [Araneus ventricosus]|uniref:Nucleic-acid-binding protein from transposon X-element n=1 Tax=Araneus ventricosus TaxID=182803 RepID=A0A4Y2PDC4_ARAVE|nr:hypothetical protein AVEN_105713-1 [Araneus ventricosus]
MVEELKAEMRKLENLIGFEGKVDVTSRAFTQELIRALESKYKDDVKNSLRLHQLEFYHDLIESARHKQRKNIEVEEKFLLEEKKDDDDEEEVEEQVKEKELFKKPEGVVAIKAENVDEWIHLTLTDNVSEIYKLDTLCYHFISVEEYRSRLHYQCFNCQRWNHGSNGCKLNPRCVVCSENHPSKECPLKGQTSNTPKCANCNGPHIASYRGCPRYPQNIQKSKIQPGKSFADALKSKYESVNKPPPQKTTANDSEISQPPSTVKSNENFPSTNTPINHSEISDIMAIVAEFKKIFRNMKNIRATVQQLQAAEGAFEKIAILAEALR